MIDERGVVSVRELSAHFSVSEATIRRDLEQLDSLGWVKRDHGGAVRADAQRAEPPVLQRIAVQAGEKERIGQLAASLIKDGETIFIGSGTTTLAVARNLEGVEHLTVITNALNIANQLLHRTGISLIVIGGQVRDSEFSLIGPLTEQALKDLRADRVFLGIRRQSHHRHHHRAHPCRRPHQARDRLDVSGSPCHRCRHSGDRHGSAPRDGQAV
jgi:DeoR/GlpR family transcriptional regulator of sugar metabolism